MSCFISRWKIFQVIRYIQDSRENRYRGHFTGVRLRKKGKCTSCISRGTISRSSLESRIRFLPSSMLAIPALWSPPGIAVAGTPDTPPANVPIPVTFVGIVAVCGFRIVSFRIYFFIFLKFRFHFHTFGLVFFSDSTFFPPWHFYAWRRFQVFTAAYVVSRLRRRASITSVSVSAFPRHSQSRHFRFFRVLAYLYIFCCIVATIVAMVTYTLFPYFGTCVRWHRSIVRIIYVGFYYLHWYSFFFRVSVGNISQALIGR